MLGTEVGDAGNYEKNKNKENLERLKKKLGRIGVIERSSEQVSEQVSGALSQQFEQMSSQDSEPSSDRIWFKCILKRALPTSGEEDSRDDSESSEREEYQSQPPAIQAESSRAPKRKNPHVKDGRGGKKPCRDGDSKGLHKLMYTVIA